MTVQTRKDEVESGLAKDYQATVTKPKPRMKGPASVVDEECEAAGKCLLGKPVSKLTRAFRWREATIETDSVKTHARNKSRVRH